mmetsp:Transcript_29925/g.73636  ORF Transcript_29925/g.73636 Transcript_29925/m.73636 type:complete len:192 (+) Transcript_29925:25-600(+)|eukprot:CAMPEP_0206247846 /NCGR_PEP_ID=MMETSP0047_2-20121206/20036_1 /ASSEMBLY_ACC=CAM_ASM_000192 /TAXON_ID=195065 /ORGANISM="Chroomonas mesostigmatica_cf, Strain CCMP1168" /LENGTH=191 /DNA_ID=CAMNT_0053673415 /DNA_START=24 /DNA_END=599 /DNA_ORIENTATION=-
MTSIKDAIKNFEAKTSSVASEAEKVLLYGQLPPIVKMDSALGTLKACKHLALSSNCVEKITGLKGLDSLEVLSIGRNQIKKLEGLDDVAGTLRELWISYNLIDKLNGLEKLTNLVVVYMSNNLIAKWTEFDRFKDLTKIEELLFVGNPLWETHTKTEDFRINVAGRIPWLKKLDGVPVDDDEKERGKAIVG